MSSRENEADVWYQLLRARRLGMFVARTDDERKLVNQIEGRFGNGAHETHPKALGDLVRLRPNEYESVREAIDSQVRPLREAYLRGMAIAHTDEQREVLTELRKLVGPSRDG